VIYDITPLASPDLAVWPGDTPLSREVLLDLAAGANITLSTLTATVHLGAHADAPSHYGRGAPAIDQVSLEPYLGPCVVIEVNVGRGERVGTRHLELPEGVSRVLLRTGTYPDPETFNEDFSALDPELVRDLGDRGVRLLGLDTPSVDLFDSKDLPAHQAFLEKDMVMLEGLVLEGVPAGRYELIALPLKLEGFDASPVRAILRTL
jgi:arylformamidase